MKKFVCLALVLVGFAPISAGQDIPKELWGKWTIRRELPTRAISCWGDADAKKIVGTHIEYSARAFRWKEVVVKGSTARTRLVTAEQFRTENSSPSSNGSQVDFTQLGITAKQAEEISIQHPPANISGATVETPGDNVLVKDSDTIIFSVCNTYFEAKRVRDHK
jgi:hypothetical protein